jgi:hypothetical protein
MLNPVESTRNLSQVPAASMTVSHKPAVPATDPMMVLQPPVTTAPPELYPTKIFDALAWQRPAKLPMKLLLLPVVFEQPA